MGCCQSFLIQDAEFVALRGEISIENLNGAERSGVVARERSARANESGDVRDYARLRSHQAHHDG